MSCTKRCHADVIAEKIVALLLTHGISVSRAVLQITDGHEVLLANFINERRYLQKGTAIAQCDCLHQVKDCHKMCNNDYSDLDTFVAVSSTLLSCQRHLLLKLIRQFTDCFPSPSKVQQTPLTKHRIIMDDSMRPIWQNPYRVVQQEREEIEKQVANYSRMTSYNLPKVPGRLPWPLLKRMSAPCASA